MIRTTEVLAPAGSFECVLGAVRCGADAVYLGTRDFNARRNAENFDLDELKKTVLQNGEQARQMINLG